MTYGQVGLVDSVGFALALVLDIPTGALADLLGKKRTILIAMVLSSIGTYFIASSTSLAQLFWGWMVASIGITFYSGAAEALAYDSLAEHKNEHEYQHIISTSHSISLFTLAAATLIGGFLYAYNFRLPQYLWMLGYLFGIVFALLLKEPTVDTFKFSFSNYFNQLALGVKELLAPALRSYFPFFFILLGVEFIYGWGLVRPAMATSFGFYAKEQSIILSALALLSAVIIRFIPYLRKKISDIKGLIFLTTLTAVSFFIGSFHIGYYGIFVMIMLAIVGKLGYPWISIVVNHHIPSVYRATTLSSVSFITKIPYILLAVVAGNAVQNGYLWVFTAGMAAAIVVGIILSLMLYIYSPKPAVIGESV